MTIDPQSSVPVGPMAQGTWPEHCEQRAFVEGAAWWEYDKTGGTMWLSDRRTAEAEAVKRYGEPVPLQGSAPSGETETGWQEKLVASVGNLGGLVIAVRAGLMTMREADIDAEAMRESLISTIDDAIGPLLPPPPGAPPSSPECSCWLGDVENRHLCDVHGPKAPQSSREPSSLLATLEQLAGKWLDEADGVTAMGYSQQGDRMRDCASELEQALAAMKGT